MMNLIPIITHYTAVCKIRHVTSNLSVLMAVFQVDLG